MQNEYGLDVSYFKSKLARVLRDIAQYNPDELARELARLAKTANKNTLFEDEFCPSINSDIEHKSALANLDKLVGKIEAYESDRWPIEKPTQQQLEQFRVDNSMCGFISQLPQRYWSAYVENHPSDNELVGACFVKTFCDFVADDIKSKAINSQGKL